MGLWIKSQSVNIQMTATEQNFPVVLFIIVDKVVLNFESLEKILKYDHSNESYWAGLFRGTVYYAVRGSKSCFISVDKILECDHSNEFYRAELSRSIVYYAEREGTKF